MILFATTRATRKYGNITAKSGVALLVDNRSNEVADIREAMAVTVIGTACEISESLRKGLGASTWKSNPHMKEFLSSTSTGPDQGRRAILHPGQPFSGVATLNLQP